MKISVVAPVLNEIRFIKGWYENVKKFSDERIIVDTGSIDGTYEWLQSQKDQKLLVLRWPEIYKPYAWPEHEIRNWMLKQATGDWIMPLDIDEMVNSDFIENLNMLSSAEWLIGRFICLQFWGDYEHLRKRKLWPIARFSYTANGKRTIGFLRNWQGWYPNRFPRLCKRDDRINYSVTGNHCRLQYKNFGRLSYHLPITKDFNIGVCHFHYAHFGKAYGGRNSEQFKNINVVSYHGELPDEIKYY